MKNTKEKLESEVKSQIRKEMKITLDNKPGDVLNLDTDGWDLYFDDERFLDLGELASKLSHDNKIRYNVAKMSFEDAKKPKPSAIKISPAMASASKRLELTDEKGIPLKDDKFHRCWKRSDQLQSCINVGYVHCREGEDGISFGGEAGTIITCGKAGYEELYAMKIPIEKYQALQKAIRDRSDQLNGAVETTTEEELEKAGGRPFKDSGSKDGSLNWGNLSSPE